MGDRRMLTSKVTDDDHFVSLSASAQALYLHLSMSADDDGFCNQVALCMFKAHASVSDLEALLKLRYLYQFESGVIVIKHWRMANALRKDRYTPTVWQKEFAMLNIKDNGSYTMSSDGCQMVADWLPNGCQVVAERLPNGCPNISKDKISKDNLIDSGQKRSSRFTPPTLEEVKAYASEAQLHVDPERFYRYFTTPNDKGETWVDSKGNKVKNWKQKMLTWDKTDSTIKTAVAQEKPRKKSNFDNYQEYGVSHPRLEDIDFDIDEL